MAGDAGRLYPSYPRCWRKHSRRDTGIASAGGWDIWEDDVLCLEFVLLAFLLLGRSGHRLMNGFRVQVFSFIPRAGVPVLRCTGADVTRIPERILF